MLNYGVVHTGYQDKTALLELRIMDMCSFRVLNPALLFLLKKLSSLMERELKVLMILKGAFAGGLL